MYYEGIFHIDFFFNRYFELRIALWYVLGLKEMYKSKG